MTWTHSEDGTVHKYRVENIPTRSDESYKLTLDFDLDPKRNVEMEVPRKGEYIVLDHTVQTEPLAVVVTFSEPLKPNQDFRNLIRFRPEIPDLGRPEPPLHLPRNATHGELRGRNQPRGAEQGGAPTRRKLHLHRGAALAGPRDPLHGQRLHLPSSNRMSLLFEP